MGWLQADIDGYDVRRFGDPNREFGDHMAQEGETSHIPIIILLMCVPAHPMHMKAFRVLCTGAFQYDLTGLSLGQNSSRRRQRVLSGRGSTCNRNPRFFRLGQVSRDGWVERPRELVHGMFALDDPTELHLWDGGILQLARACTLGARASGELSSH